jgi:hypothetical protein
MNANEALQMIKLFEAGVISHQTFCEKMQIPRETLIAQELDTDEGRVALAQAMVEPIRRETDELLQKEKLKLQKISRFDLI